MDIRDLSVPGWERIVVAREGDYHGIVAIHSTALGPALGGTRFMAYPGEAEALSDVLRLSRGMSYKSAIAGLPMGGGKAVILAPAGEFDRAALLRAHGRLVESLGGAYITAEDVGTAPADMDLIALETRHVAGTSAASGDPSPHTARGVFRAIQAAAALRWGRSDLAGLRVAIQGVGNVGRALAAELSRAGAQLWICDTDVRRAGEAAETTGAQRVEPDAIYDVPADVFSPCALGGTLSATTIPRLHCEVVAGGANNQLADPEDGVRLAARDILYVPDFVANAGGVTTGCGELLGMPPEWSATRVEAIFETVNTVLRAAADRGVLPHEAAERIAEARIAAAASLPGGAGTIHE